MHTSKSIGLSNAAGHAKSKPKQSRFHAIRLAVRQSKAALSHSKVIRERLLGFGISCCLHVALLIGLSLIAIGSGALPGSLLLEASPAEVENPALNDDSNLWLTADLPAAPEEMQAIEFELSDLEVSATALTRSLANTAMTKPAELTTADANKSRARSGQSAGNDLEGMQALAASGIQSRVTKAGGRKGEVQFALAWRNVNDVDLHVIAPSGEHISYQHRRSKCSGMLDVDMNVEGESEEPVENVRWLRNAPWGRYTILVNLYRINSNGDRRPRRETPYQLLAQLGNESLMREEVAGFGRQQVTVWRFMYIPSSFPSMERERMLQQLTALQMQEESLAEPMLDQARAATDSARQRLLENIARQYPHTDSAIEALQLMDGKVVKKSSSQ